MLPCSCNHKLDSTGTNSIITHLAPPEGKVAVPSLYVTTNKALFHLDLLLEVDFDLCTNVAQVLVENSDDWTLQQHHSEDTRNLLRSRCGTCC